MEDLWRQVERCPRCEHLQEHVNKRVFGDGSVHARVMLVGEGPGADEDASGHPFVGEAGQLLTDILTMAGFPDRNHLFIANTVKCRCWSKKGITLKNRKPSQKEILACWPFLARQIKIVNPKVIVGLGGTAIAALKGVSPSSVKSTRTAGLTEKIEGRWHLWTYHPSYPIYRGRDVALIEQMVAHLTKAKELSRA